MYVLVSTMKVRSGKHAEARKLAREWAEHVNKDLSPEHPMHVLTPRFGAVHETLVFTQEFESLSALDDFQRKGWSDEGFKARRNEWFELVDVNSISYEVFTLVM